MYTLSDDTGISANTNTNAGNNGAVFSGGMSVRLGGKTVISVLSRAGAPVSGIYRKYGNPSVSCKLFKGQTAPDHTGGKCLWVLAQKTGAPPAPASGGKSKLCRMDEPVCA